MGIKFGEIDASQILENEFSIKILSKLLQWVFDNNPKLKKPTQQQYEGFKKEVVRELQKKYPKSGVKLK